MAPHLSNPTPSPGKQALVRSARAGSLQGARPRKSRKTEPAVRRSEAGAGHHHITTALWQGTWPAKRAWIGKATWEARHDTGWPCLACIGHVKVCRRLSCTDLRDGAAKEWKHSGSAPRFPDPKDPPYDADQTGNLFNRVQTFEVGESQQYPDRLISPSPACHCEDRPCVPVCAQRGQLQAQGGRHRTVDYDKCI